MAEKILVSGGTGYIGSHTAVELQKKGFEVIIVDNLHNSELSVLDGIEAITGSRPCFEKIDLCNKEALSSFVKKQGKIRAAIHFAAYKSVSESVNKPLEYYRNNIVSLLNMLEVMKEASISAMVFSSSCTVYGQPDTLPVNEEAPVKEAASPYGYTKQAGENILKDAIAALTDLKGSHSDISTL